ncbi:hypothetical protein BN1200_530001 [Klebsiella variicola]|nr:hypothetical protein BN1200_530001 [Klebsiella variicola]
MHRSKSKSLCSWIVKNNENNKKIIDNIQTQNTILTRLLALIYLSLNIWLNLVKSKSKFFGNI